MLCLHEIFIDELILLNKLNAKTYFEILYLTEKGLREKNRNYKPDKLESLDQFIYRIKAYLEKCIELSSTEATYQGLTDLINKNRFCVHSLNTLASTRTDVHPNNYFHDPDQQNNQKGMARIYDDTPYFTRE